MCVACIEYVKDKLTDREFQSALRETTVEDAQHLREVEKIFQESAGKPDEIKKKLKDLE